MPSKRNKKRGKRKKGEKPSKEKKHSPNEPCATTNPTVASLEEKSEEVDVVSPEVEEGRAGPKGHNFNQLVNKTPYLLLACGICSHLAEDAVILNCKEHKAEDLFQVFCKSKPQRFHFSPLFSPLPNTRQNANKKY